MLLRLYRTIYKFVLSRRYRVSIEGLDLLQAEGAKLILPNHQSHVDPQIIAVECFKYSDIVPVVSERFFKIPIVKFFLKKWNAVAVTQMKPGTRDLNVLKRIYAKVIEALHSGKTVIIYPSGQLQDIGVEKIKNKQSAYLIVSELPDNVKVLGLHVQGLWGSMFSKAWNGTRPKFLPAFLKGIFFFFANFVLLCPKRDVRLEFVDITVEAKKQAKEDRRTFNTFMEEFYFTKGVEDPTYIKHLFFLPKSKRKLPASIQKKYDVQKINNKEMISHVS